MKTNLKKIGEIIQNNDDFVLIPHKNPDGDCLGSVMALARAIKSMGKKVKVALVGGIPARLDFLWDKDFLADNEKPAKVCITVDVAATYMIDELKEKLLDKADITCCIDHHGTNSGFAMVNYVDATAAATGEIIYELIYDILNIKRDAKIDEGIYSAIASDTGSFQYSNTTARTHIIASKLVDGGIDCAKIMRNLFEKKQLASLKLMNEIIQSMEFYYEGKLCIVTIDGYMLKKYGMTFQDADEYSPLPRSIDGVEVGAILKVYAKDEVKVSLRSNEYVDVASLAKELGGGGHIRAAGVTLKAGRDEAKKILIDKIKEVIKQ